MKRGDFINARVRSKPGEVTFAKELYEQRIAVGRYLNDNERLQVIIEVLKWLYLNDNKFGSGSEWKEEFIKFLMEVL